MTNADTLDRLFAQNTIAIRRGSLFGTAPATHVGISFDRLEGMILGLALGDSLGNTTEGQLPMERAAAFGEIRDYLPNRYAAGRPVGLPSDDSQLALWTLEQMVRDGAFVPENVARRFCSGQIFGIGSAVREFVHNHRDGGLPWYAAGPASAGNGALMRIAPMLFPHLATGTANLWVDAGLSAMTTHNDSASIGSCLAFISILWQLLAMDGAPTSRWWLDSFLNVAADVDLGTIYKPRGGSFVGYRGAFPTFVKEVVRDAMERGLSTLEAANGWYSGAYLLETVPSVLYILMRHGNDPEEAIIRAVNDTRDNDTVAAIVGAAMGALHGRSALARRWIDGLLGRTAEGDDGRLFSLLTEARAAFFEPNGGAALVS